MNTTNRESTVEPSSSSRTSLLALGAAVVVLLLVLAWLAYRTLRRLDAVDRRVASLSAEVSEATNRSREALQTAQAAEASARAAAQGRQTAEAAAQAAADRREAAEASAREAAQEREAAEAQTAGAWREAEKARREAAMARDAAARAETEMARARSQAEAEVNRLEQALGQIAETRRTALGLVMTLGSDYLKFEFDKAELRAEDRELLSRIAGILLTSKDYSISVNGHTDDVGSSAYNQKLSERRAGAVRDYLVESGLSLDILTVTGHGKARPLAPGTSEAARAKNRRVELGVVNTRIIYGRSTQRK